jgi:urease beta subunit
MITARGDISLNEGRIPIKIIVNNLGDRPIQVGSHFHFFEVNRFLEFPRKEAFGKRLNIPAGTSIRFEPGDRKEVELIDLAGKKKVYGLNGLTNGRTLKEAAKAAREKGFRGA